MIVAINTSSKTSKINKLFSEIIYYYYAYVSNEIEVVGTINQYSSTTSNN